MKTIYLITTTDYISIKESINKILKDNNLSSDCIIKYDLTSSLIESVIEDLDTYNFLVEKKVVVIENCSFLSGSKARGAVDQNVDLFIKYLNNPSSENILVVICDKLDERKSVVKALRENSIVLDDEVSIRSIVKSRVSGYKMEDSVVKYLIDYCNNDNEKILNELDKLLAYKFNEKEIVYDDIDNIVIKSYSDDIFGLIDAIMSRNKKKAYCLYREFIDNGEDINRLLSLLTDQFRMIYNGKVLLKDYHNNYKEVAGVLGIHPYRFQKAMESSMTYSVKSISENLNKLNEIEVNMKTGKSINGLFEVFLYKL